MSFDHRGKIRTAIIVLTTLGLCALFLADGAMSLLAGVLLPMNAPATAPPRKPALGELQGSDAPDPRSILARNIFDPSTGPLPRPPDTDPLPSTGPDEVQCEDSALRLLAVVHSLPHPEESIAALTSGTGETLLYQEGDSVENDEVAAILPTTVVLRRRNQRHCSLTLFGSGAASPRTRALPLEWPPPPASRIGRVSEEQIDRNVSALSDTKYAVARAFVDEILRNPGEIMVTARIVPESENGIAVGVKLYGIRRNSLLGKLGLQNGDLLRTVNGLELSTPDLALEAYGLLRSASQLSVAVTRRGQPLNLEYEIQ